MYHGIPDIAVINNKRYYIWDSCRCSREMYVQSELFLPAGFHPDHLGFKKLIDPIADDQRHKTDEDLG